jgi:hypothetical protein
MNGKALRQYLLLACILCFAGRASAANLKQDSFRLSFNASVNMLFGWQSTQSFFFSFGVNSQLIDPNVRWLTPNLGLNCNVYQGTIGTSSLPKYQNKIHVDLIGSFFASVGQSRDDAYDFQQIEGFVAYSSNVIENRYDHWSAMLGTSFILNKERPQHIGYIGLSAWDVSLVYYNDGGPIVKDIGLSGKNDRWWTGGLTLSVHPRNWAYRVKVNYNVFTGYNRDVFEVSNLLKLKRVMYKDEEQVFLNNGLLTVDVRHESGFGFGLDFMSSKMMWLQNFTHVSGEKALHDSMAPWRPDVRFFYDPNFTITTLR